MSDARRTLKLSREQRRELEALRGRHDKPYVREWAAALLKVADGWTASAAAAGLLKEHRQEDVSAWPDRYRGEGAAGLDIRKGRGRKPAFSPLGASRTAGQAPARGGAPPLAPALRP